MKGPLHKTQVNFQCRYSAVAAVVYEHRQDKSGGRDNTPYYTHFY